DELLEQYHSKWNWQLLKQNPGVIEKLDSVLSKYKVEMNCVTFLERFPQKPYVYHFTHLFNAVEIIKKRKILSRNKADGKFANAAANIVDRRSTAHDYARFYYRPQTPTQFYNECLGWDSMLQTSWGKSYYSQAFNMGLPKCPMPVFFKFDLSEVVSHMADKCYYSTGNMQTNWAKILKISDIPDRLNAQGVYSTIQNDGIVVYKEYSQQEFLVLDEFDFSNLHSFEIICYDEEQAEILKSQLVGDDIVDKITSYSDGVFHRNNREITIYDSGDSISFCSDYNGNAHFEVRCQDKNVIQNAKVIKETSDTVFAYPSLEIAKSNVPIEIRFVDERNRSWTIYKN
ncbi:MAG: DarT ssDNA thymidine ADP-ribosyltransferase family protein, partial [Bacteroidales bacterium]|nr:DarT ssDNA thymidine ADP-ribosyltransferase family protein [Bacteroidales bacterium]